MHDDKPTEIVRPVDIDYVGLHPSDGGVVILGFVTDRRVDVDLHLTPEILAKLEAKLAEVRQQMAAKRGLQ